MKSRDFHARVPANGLSCWFAFDLPTVLAGRGFVAGFGVLGGFSAGQEPARVCSSGVKSFAAWGRFCGVEGRAG